MTASAGKARRANKYATAASLPLFPGCSLLSPPPARKYFSGESALKERAVRLRKRARRQPVPKHQGSAAACACAALRRPLAHLHVPASRAAAAAEVS